MGISATKETRERSRFEWMVFRSKTVVHQNHHSSLGLAQTKFDLGQMQRYCSRCIPESDTKMMGFLSAKNQREAGIGRFVPLVAAPVER